MNLRLGIDKGKYRCRFTYQGKRQTVYFGTDDHATATRLLRRLELDLLNGTLNSDLKVYRLDYQPTQGSKEVKTSKQNKVLTLRNVWDTWIQSLDLPSHTINGDYHYTRCCIPSSVRWDEYQWFIEWSQGKSSGNISKRKSHLKRCIDYHLSLDTITGVNPYDTIKLNKERLKESQSTKVKPLTETEIKSILQAFESNQFVDSNSRFNHSHYLPLVKFLFTYGCRLGEALALSWEQVDFQNRIITIDRAVSRDTELSPYTSRKVIKETKTGIVNYLPLVEPIYSDLLEQSQKSNNPLVFPGHYGKVMDSKRFRIIWKTILSSLSIPYRYPYQIRHTVLSNVAKNHGLAAAASLAGHKDLTMVSKHYVKFIGDKKDIIPDLIHKDSEVIL